MKAAIIGMTEPGQNNGAFVGTPVAVGVFEGHEVRRVGDIEFALAPYQPHRRGEFIGENSRRFILAVTIAIFEQADAAFADLVLEFRIKVVPGGFRDIEPPFIVQGGEHRKVDGRRAGNTMKRKTTGDLEYRFTWRIEASTSQRQAKGQIFHRDGCG
jgi:hypothetical protein